MKITVPPFQMPIIFWLVPKTNALLSLTPYIF